MPASPADEPITASEAGSREYTPIEVSTSLTLRRDLVAKTGKPDAEVAFWVAALMDACAARNWIIWHACPHCFECGQALKSANAEIVARIESVGRARAAAMIAQNKIDQAQFLKELNKQP